MGAKKTLHETAVQEYMVYDYTNNESFNADWSELKQSNSFEFMELFEIGELAVGRTYMLYDLGVPTYMIVRIR